MKKKPNEYIENRYIHLASFFAILTFLLLRYIRIPHYFRGRAEQWGHLPKSILWGDPCNKELVKLIHQDRLFWPKLYTQGIQGRRLMYLLLCKDHIDHLNVTISNGLSHLGKLD